MRTTRRFIMAAVLWAVCLQGGIRPDIVTAGFQYETAMLSGPLSGSTGFAQNGPEKPPDRVSDEDASKIRDDTNKPKTSTPEKKVPEGIKPVKPFVPSERIPADQGFDFPYDI